MNYMAKLLLFFTHPQTRSFIMTSNRSYGLCNFLFDVIMTCITAGFWLIWVFVREMRKR